jgi:hypothetical protein
MNKKDILELKRRLKKDDCTFTKMCGCYVNGEKNVILKFRETFLNLREEEFFKYLEIAKKTLSGTVGNNILELNFPVEEGNNISSRQLSLMELKRSALKNDVLLDEFYDLIIDSYEYAGNFLILLFHDAYDVIIKTTDNGKLDESEEVYEYVLCAICPVELTEPGLGYFEDNNRIGARIRDWVVGAPDLGFVFPAFTDRSADIHSIMYYTKNAKNPHPEFMEQALGCISKQTAAEQKETFTTIIQKAIGSDDKKSERIFMEIQDTLNTMVEDNNAINGKDAEPIALTMENIQDVLIENGIPDEITKKIEKSYTEVFGDTPPVVEHLIDKKVIAANEQRKKEERLEKKVRILEERLEQTKQVAELVSEKEIDLDAETDTLSATDSNSNLEVASDINLQEDSETTSDQNTDIEIKSDRNPAEDYDIVLQVKPEKVTQIKSQIIDGKKCIVIPLDENEQANVNGVSTVL